MTQTAGQPARAGAHRLVPVTDPVRVLVVDSDIHSGTALSKEIDMDKELAVVGFCRDPRRASIDADRCRPDLVAIRLGLDDEKCAAVLVDLAGGSANPCVVVLGAPNGPADAHRDARIMKARIRVVAETSFGLAPQKSTPAQSPAGGLLN